MSLSSSSDSPQQVDQHTEIREADALENAVIDW